MYCDADRILSTSTLNRLFSSGTVHRSVTRCPGKMLSPEFGVPPWERSLCCATLPIRLVSS